MQGALDYQILNFDEGKNLLKEGIQDEADQVAQLKADLKQLSDNTGSINITNSINSNIINTSISSRQAKISLEADDKEFTVVELGQEREENTSFPRNNSSHRENNAHIEEINCIINNNDDGAKDQKSMTGFLQTIKIEQQTTEDIKQETSVLTAVKDIDLDPSIEGKETQELLSKVQDLKVKLEVDVDGRLSEFSNTSWVSFESKFQTGSNFILLALLFKGLFIFLTGFDSFKSLWSLEQPISRIVMLYFIKSFFIMYFHYQLMKLLFVQINLYHNYKEQLLKQKSLMETFLSQITKKIQELKEVKKDTSEKKADTKKNKDIFFEKYIKNSQKKNDKDLEKEEFNLHKDSQIPQLTQNNNNTINSNENVIPKIQISPEQEPKTPQEQEGLQAQPNNKEVSSSNLPASQLQIQSKNQQKPKKPSLILPPIPSEIEVYKLKINKIIIELTQLCDGEQYKSLNELKMKLDTENSSNLDAINNFRSALLVSQTSLQSLFDFLQFFSLIMTICSFSYVVKDIPENVSWEFVVIIWLNIVQDNLQILGQVVIVGIVIVVLIVTSVFSFFKGIISQKLRKRRFNQLCKSLPRLICKPNNTNTQEAGDISNTKECSICLAEYLEGEVQIQLPCNGQHLFHEECIISWIKVRNDCPMCRKFLF